MKELKRKYYQTELIRIHRGNSRGVFINAKPLYVISLIECIDKGILLENKIEYPAPEIEKVYLETCEKYEPGRKLSPFILPYFHISTESFYDIQWKEQSSFHRDMLTPLRESTSKITSHTPTLTKPYGICFKNQA